MLDEQTAKLSKNLDEDVERRVKNLREEINRTRSTLKQITPSNLISPSLLSNYISNNRFFFAFQNNFSSTEIN